MNEFLLYAGISLLALLLFFFWYHRQGRAAEKKWILQQLEQTDASQQQPLIDSLSRIKAESSAAGKITGLMALLILPATFLIDYLWFHEIPIEARTSMAAAESSAPDMESAIKQLEQKLADNPNDLEGQLLYGRSMMSLQRYEKAVGAYQQANQLSPNDPNILTELAESIAFRNNTGSFLGEPEVYLQQAIKLDPQHQKAMWLQGIVFYETQQFEQAESIWTELLGLVQNDNIKTTITKQINQARMALNKPPLTVEQDSSASYFVVIDATEEIKALDFGPNARLFVFAKQLNGPPMPIAAFPYSAPFAWPLSVTLTDQHSLNPERRLSTFERVTLSAKLSLSGVATPAEDDITSNQITAQANQSNLKLLLAK